MNKRHIILSEEFKQELIAFTTKGEQKVKATKRALALLQLDEGKMYKEVEQNIGLSGFQLRSLCANVGKAETEHTPLINVLFEKPRPGRPSVFTATDKAKITALACSTPPEGHTRWSLRLLADKAVELELVEHISHNAVGELLKKTSLNLI
jgi:Homeodomain-like domain